jgi:hypothetical protein
MKQKLVFVIALTVGISGARGQTSATPSEQDLPGQVAVARCAYTPDDTCPNATNLKPNPDDKAPLLAQLPRRSPPRRMGPMGAPPRYPGFGPPEHLGSALIGAVLLGGLGGSLAYNTHPNGQPGPNVGAAVFCGGMGALIGWVIGDHISFGHHRGYHRQPWPDEFEDEAATHRKRARQAASFKQPSPTQSSPKRQSDDASPIAGPYKYLIQGTPTPPAASDMQVAGLSAVTKVTIPVRGSLTW